MLYVMTQTHNPNTQEVETGAPRVQAHQSGLRETLSQTQDKIRKKTQQERH